MTQAEARFDTYCAGRGIVARTQIEKATLRLTKAAWVAAERGWHYSVKDQVNALCTCGGAGNDDPFYACPVCKLYHALRMDEWQDEQTPEAGGRPVLATKPA